MFNRGGENGKIRVVFVEDRNNEWRGLRKLLAADNKLEIYEAASVREAFIKARELPIDVILLDNLLPDMSGFNVCEELMKGLKRTKVIVLSAQNDFSSVQEALSEGCVIFVQNASYREIRRYSDCLPGWPAPKGIPNCWHPGKEEAH